MTWMSRSRSPRPPSPSEVEVASATEDTASATQRATTDHHLILELTEAPSEVEVASAIEDTASAIQRATTDHHLTLELTEAPSGAAISEKETASAVGIVPTLAHDLLSRRQRRGASVPHTATTLAHHAEHVDGRILGAVAAAAPARTANQPAQQHRGVDPNVAIITTRGTASISADGMAEQARALPAA